MRTIWYRTTVLAVSVGVSVAIAVAMLLVNYAFEAVGSITDVPPAGFLAGNLLALSIIYPVIVAVLTGRALVPVALRYTLDHREIGRCGGFSGTCGALLYFGFGAILLALSGRIGAAPPAAWLASGAYILLAWLGGRLGAYVALNRARAVAPPS